MMRYSMSWLVTGGRDARVVLPLFVTFRGREEYVQWRKDCALATNLVARELKSIKATIAEANRATPRSGRCSDLSLAMRRRSRLLLIARALREARHYAIQEAARQARGVERAHTDRRDDSPVLDLTAPAGILVSSCAIRAAF